MSSVFDESLEHHEVVLSEVRLHCVAAGSGPLVVFLHGFPEFWYSWRRQLPKIAQAGFRGVAVDMRGFNLSDKPRGVRAYAGERLAKDIAELISALGAERACVVGHDWGAGVAWQFAMLYPELLDRMVIINAPHPVSFQRALRTFRQLLRSWYMFFFQIPWLPEALIRATRYQGIRDTFRHHPIRPGAFSEEEIDRYIEAIARPGALTAGLNYYRAGFRYGLRSIRRNLRRIDAPVLVIWGEQDRYMGKKWAEPDAQWVPNARLVRLPDCSHWVQHEQPERVNELLIEFLRQ